MVKASSTLWGTAGVMAALVLVYYFTISNRRVVVVDQDYAGLPSLYTNTQSLSTPSLHARTGPDATDTPPTDTPSQETLAQVTPSTPSQDTPGAPSQDSPSTPSQGTISKSHESTSSSADKTNSSSPLPPDTLPPSPPLRSLAVGTDSPPTEVPLYDHQMVGFLNFDLWRNPPGYLVDDLRIKRDFPSSPEVRRSTTSVKVTFDERDKNAIRGKHGHKMYGYLLPRTPGVYQLRAHLSEMTAACNVEVWLSSGPSPLNITLTAAVEYPMLGRKQTGISKSGESKKIQLMKGAYYFEFLMKAYDGRCVAEIQWKEPGQDKYTAIPAESFAMAVKLRGTEYADGWPIVEVLEGPLLSNKLQSHDRVKYVGDTLYEVTYLDVLPACQFSPVYVHPHPVKQYSGIYAVFPSKVFPPDHSVHTNWYKQDRGNKQMDAKVAQKVLDLYQKAFKEKGYKGDVQVHLMEETVNKDHGSRFLLELDIHTEGEDAVQHTSEYVYLPAGSDQLCHTANFQWRKNAEIYLVVSVKNLGLWVKHLIHNMEHIYHVTGDTHFELVIVDYNSEDMDVEKELKSSSLPRWKVIKLSGGFSRSGGLQAGIDYVTDPDSIVMTLDMHLTLPPGFVEYIRRHVVQGKMGFAPMFFRLNHGYTEVNINGFWETLTYGLLGLFKSDWTVTGGFDTQKYTTKWGGEDWDAVDKVVEKGIEVFRIRYPGLVHYFHTKVGLWGSKQKTYS